MFTREQIDQVRFALDIADVIREFVPSLKASGRSMKGLCPFHTEKTPSFFVHPEKGIFKCFGCGESGDVISFVSKIENVSFTEALEKLASRAGIVLKKDDSRQKSKEPETVREQILRLLERAMAFYEEHLWDKPEGATALAYLKERGISDRVAQKFRLGMAPFQTASAFETLVAKGFSVDLCRQAGLAARSQSGRFYDPLYGRLIFPIFDNFGHVVGFGGRTLPKTKKKFFADEASSESGEAPKYINSPDSPVFSKGKLLYGLFQGKDAILKSRRVVIFEGYMDVVGTHEGGFSEGVATLGTALTRDHTHLLRRYCDEVVAFFDPDAAGYQAAERGLEPVLKEGLFPRVAVIPVKKDPDEIILQHGKEYFDEIIRKSPDFVDYLVGNINQTEVSFKDRVLAAKNLVKLISMSPDQILQTEWLHKASGKLGLNSDSLEKELKSAGAVKNNRPKERAREVKNPLSSAEEELIELMIQVPEVVQGMDIHSDELLDAKCRLVFKLIKREIEAGLKVAVVKFLDEVDESVKQWLVHLTLEEKSFPEPFERKEQLIRSIRIQNDRRRLAQLSQQIATGQMSPEELKEYKGLLQKLKGSAAVPILE